MTQSRTHYIPISGITIDNIKDIVDDAVAEVVGGLLNPDPALYCPINGYLPPDPDGKFIYPVEMPEPPNQSITLLCSKSLSNTIHIRANGAYNVKVYTSTMYEIHSENKNTNTNFTFTFTTDGYYIVIVTPQAGQNISGFQVDSHPMHLYNQPIHAAIINAPEIGTAANMFRYLLPLRSVEIVSTFDKCTSLNRFLADSGIEYFKFPASLALCTTLDYMFDNTPLRTIDFNNCNCPELTSIGYILQNTYQLQNVVINLVAPKLRTFTSAVMYTNAQNVEFNITVNAASSTPGIGSLASNSNRLKSIKFPIINYSAASIPYSSVLANCPQLETIELRGNHSMGSVSSFITTTNVRIKEVIFNGVLSVASTLLSTMYTNNRYKFTVKAAILGQLQSYQLLEEVDFQTMPDATSRIICISSALKSFNHPTLRCVQLWVGATGSAITDIDVDWANCNFNSDANVNILVRGNLSSTRLNEIYTALKDVTSAPVKVEFKNCTGYAASNTAILTAKGYVLT